ncbi:hypothetical protein J7394_19840 [Ruegeria sp. R13_0]|uniref:hypothetical protein n=1 Tax=Ruegeria sp. R13_0 TaxID=2821099 RepID=UPI001AD994FA|nr:hypothetical protein [Ruegeria sp. R13_0]MBO9436476.1 hypothetical protein [Ruegeria sp. R13_0]
MSYTYIRREQSLEELAACVISDAAAFAHICAWRLPAPKGPERRVFLHMINRLERGDVLDARDDDCIEAVGQDLVAAVNALLPGYGDFVLQSNDYGEPPIDPDLAWYRSQILLFSRFRYCRNRLRARLAARSLVGSAD